MPEAGGGQGKIQHVVIIVQENRSFDNFFDCFPGTDCVKTAPGPGAAPTRGSKSSPCPILATPSPGPTPTPIQIALDTKLAGFDIDHTYCPAFVTQYDGGKMDGFYWTVFGGPGGVAGTYPYGVVAQKQIQPYWDMAQQYVLADRAFPTQASGSFTAHQDLIRGDTAIRKDASLVDYPWNHYGIQNWGCDDPSQPPKGPSYTPLLTSSLKYISKGPFPCLDYATVRDTLDGKGVSWKYYVPVFGISGGQEWNAFDAIRAVRYSKSEWPNKKSKFTCTGSCVSWPETNVFCDIAGSTASPCPAPNPPGNVVLPAVAWVVPDQPNSDHGYGSQIGTDNGPDWVASVVNAIGGSPYWKSTAIVIVWDDWGGFYDHVPPPQLDYQGLGFRVPLMVVSPYAKKGYVSHTQYEFGSILKFVESTFGLPSLGTTDARANNLTNVFNFQQAPRPFVPIKLLNRNHNRRFFLNEPSSNRPVDTQ
ncbi:MAG: alkaline phosphatase family protein [Candidatus Tumulicola sp.]